MSPLHCNTVREALWERAASSGPASLSPALVEHMTTCATCQVERQAVSDLLEASRSLVDPEPPADLWDGFEDELQRQIHGTALTRGWHRWGRRAMSFAAVLLVGFGLGTLVMQATRGEDPVRVARQNQVLETVNAELQSGAKLEAYLTEMEELLVAYRASEHDPSLDVFRRSLPTAMVAGSGVPSDTDRERLERQRATREQLRSLVMGMLVSEIESESHGFAYLDRRIASIAGQQLLYFIH